MHAVPHRPDRKQGFWCQLLANGSSATPAFAERFQKISRYRNVPSAMLAGCTRQRFQTGSFVYPPAPTQNPNMRVKASNQNQTQSNWIKPNQTNQAKKKFPVFTPRSPQLQP